MTQPLAQLTGLAVSPVSSSWLAPDLLALEEPPPHEVVPSERLRRLDPASVSALVLAQLAMRSAGLPESQQVDPRAGLVVGTALGCQTTTLRYAERLVHKGAGATNPIDFPDSIDGAPAAHIAMLLRLGGPSITLVSGAASALTAFATAVHLVACGRAERLVVVVVDRFDAKLGTRLAGDQAREPNDPTRACAELGLGLLVESPQSAAQRGAKVMASVLETTWHSQPPHQSQSEGSRDLAGAGTLVNYLQLLAEAGSPESAAPRPARELLPPLFPGFGLRVV